MRGKVPIGKEVEGRRKEVGKSHLARMWQSGEGRTSTNGNTSKIKLVPTSRTTHLFQNKIK